MQSTLEVAEGLERKLHISVPSDDVESLFQQKLKETAKQVRLKGFRPGKVPLREVSRRFGEGIRAEISSELMQSCYSEAITREDVSPAGMPRIEDVTMENGKDLTFTAVFEVFPEITLSSFGDISVEKPVASVEDIDLNNMIEKLREQRTTYDPVERAAADGDQVNVDFTGRVDGEVFAGGEGTGVDIVIGSGRMLPDFESGLIGGIAGDEKNIDVSFPDDYQNKELAGKQAIFSIIFNTVSESVFPELDEEFMSQFGVEDGDEDKFRDEIRGNMQRELDSNIKNKIKTQVMDGLLESNEIIVPQALIDGEVNRMRSEMAQQFGGQNTIDESALPAALFEPQSKRRVSLGLIMNAIVDQNGLEADDARVRAYLEEMAASYDDPEQMVSYYYRNEDQLNNIRNVVLEDQVIDLILESAQSTEIAQSYEEAIAPPPPPEMSDDTDINDDTGNTVSDTESTDDIATPGSKEEQGAAQEKPDAAT